jgi:hydroxylaminobenzene mutase
MNVATGGRQVLLHGMLLVFVGLVWGLVVPATPFPRLALGAHIQLTVNGMLLMLLATTLLALQHQVGPRSVRLMVVTAWTTWAMALSEVANSWWGTAKMLPLAAREAGATGGEPWQESVIAVAHVVAGVLLIVSWALLVVGFMKRPSGGARQG